MQLALFICKKKRVVQMKENNNKICREMKINHFHVKHKLFIYPPFTLHGEEPLFLCRKMEIVHM